MAKFLFVPHHRREEAIELSSRTMDQLAARGHKVGVLRSDAEIVGLSRWAVSQEEAREVDLAISIGGDGTMLRALDLMHGPGVPVMGVNVGHLGYLTEVEPGELDVCIDRFLSGDYHVEERMALEVTVTSAPQGDPTNSTITLSRQIAVNEVVVERTASGNTVRLEAVIDAVPFLAYAVDGMIVATPTGSTAYNLSARGPILSPILRAILMTPVSPHMLFDRSVVLSSTESLELRILGTRSASVVVDGRHIATISVGGTISCREASQPARIVAFQGRDFRQVLKAKFGLIDR